MSNWRLFSPKNEKANKNTFNDPSAIVPIPLYTFPIQVVVIHPLIVELNPLTKESIIFCETIIIDYPICTSAKG